MRIGIDATNIGGNGGITHLKEILHQISFLSYSNEIKKIIVFSSDKNLLQIPNSELIDKVTFSALNKSILRRVIFQIFFFDKEIKNRCDILFSITGDYIGNFKPVVSMSQNMLLYERDIWKEIKQFKEILRFWLIYQKQKYCFKNSNGIIFISNYAKEYISKLLNLKGKQITVINHGISPRFISKIKVQKQITEYSFLHPFKLVYVSTVHVYKHQWNVVEAIGRLRDKGYPVELNLLGGVIFEPAGKRLEVAIQKIDPENQFIHNHGHVPYEEIDKFYKSADGIIFASTCENMPNILIESMASGIPIASSNKQPMPEFLKNAGFYFNAHKIDSIVSTLIDFLDSPKKREINAINALTEVSNYSWNDNSQKTFEFLISICKNYQNVQK